MEEAESSSKSEKIISLYNKLLYFLLFRYP